MAHSILKPLANIIIVEDDFEMLELEQYHLEKAGYAVTSFSSTKNVEHSLEGIDLIIMDRKLPDIEGSDFIRYLRDKGIKIPVIFVSSKARDKEVIEGFISGGDDYIRKPFDISEFLFRVKALLKRTRGVEDAGRLQYRDILIDKNERKVFIENEEIELTKLEFDLLTYFVEHKNKVISREKLLCAIWNDYENVQKRTVNVSINRLRKKIDPHLDKIYIVPIHGIGYKFI